MKKLILIIFLTLLSLQFALAFEQEKYLIQTSTDDYYPCELVDTGLGFTCGALNSQNISDWNATLNETYQAYLATNQTFYQINNNTPELIDISGLHAWMIDPYAYDYGTIFKIGFGTNTFIVSGTPLENFDVNTTTGMVRYRPLNMTWLNFTSSQYVDLGTGAISLLNLNQSWSFWFKSQSISTYQNIISYYQAGSHTFWIGLNASTIWARCNFLTAGNPSFSANLTLSSDTWYHVVVQCNMVSNVSAIYINGINYFNSTAQPTFTPDYGAYKRIGFNTKGLIGQIDEFRFYNYTLSSDNISIIYNSGRISNFSITNNNLIEWLDFNSNSGTILTSKGGLGYNGTITGATWQSDNINVTTLGYPVNISIVNMSNALIFWDNYTLINNSKIGNQTFSFLNNQTIWILDNFKVNQSNNIYGKSPIWFSISNSTTKHIASNLSDTINATVILNATGITCNSAYNFTYISNTGKKTEWLNSGAKSVCTNLTTTGQTLIIDNSTSSNDLEMDFDTTAPTITIISPIAQTYANETINIEFSATDNVAVDKLWYSVDKGTNTTYTGVVPYFFGRKSHTIIFYANDTSGNLASQSVSFSTNIALTACESGVSAFVSYAALLGIVGVILFLGLLVSYLTGLVEKTTFTNISIIGSIVTLIFIALLIIIGVFVMSTLCGLF